MTTEVTDIGVGTIRTGLLGGGFMARVHTAAARAAGADLVGVATSTAAGGAAAARDLGYRRAGSDAAALLADGDIDVVHVCTPNTTHAGLARAALLAGVHVVCEKPLATSVDDARALVALAQERGLVGAVPFVYRYHPMIREARARVAQGEIGAVLTVDAAYLQDWMLLPSDDDWRADGDAGGPSRAFADIGSHLFDLIEFVSGQRVTRVSARTRRVYDRRGDDRVVRNEDIAAVMFDLASGAVGTALISQMAAGRKNALTLELHGARRSVRFEQERPEELWIGDRISSQLLLRDPATASADAARIQRVPAGHPMGYQDAFDAFVIDAYAAIRGGAPEGLPTFADGLRAAVLTDAVLASAAADSWIEVPA
ncbi:Gfo/Idh/MocA family protein [Microbacterium sp. PA5]|uniref:Gfo/Idh/MocA family protein n=1 Tax=Microbacterium sp. PA5 TaxID=3416654 RepID=UPI003CF9255F